MNAKIVRSIGLCFAITLAILAQDSTDIGHEIVSDLRAGKFAEATDLLHRALKESPRDARLWTLNGLALVRLGKQNDALASYNRALQLSPDYLPALEGAAQIEFETGRPKLAATLHRILTIDPNNASAHSMLASIAFKQGDCKTAREEWTKSRPAATEAEALREFGACLVTHKRLAEAISVFDHLATLQPGNPSAQYDLALVHFLAGHYKEVIAILAPATTRPADADALELLAEAYESTSQTPRAKAALQRAIDLNPSVARYYLDFANICQTHGDFQQGIAMLNAGLRQMPDSPPLYLARGLLYSELAEYQKGEDDMNTAERLDPNVALGSAVRGLAELQQNDLGKAEKTVRERLRIHPGDGFLYYLLAEILLRKGAAPGSPEFDEAFRAAFKSVELRPGLTVSRDTLARLYLEQGKPEQAIEQSRLALKNNPSDQVALYHLIQALRKAGRTEELPAAVKQLATLREQGQKQEAVQRRLAPFEQIGSGGAASPDQ